MTDNKRFLIVTMLLITTGTAGWICYAQKDIERAPRIKIQDFPMTVGEWTASDDPVTMNIDWTMLTENYIMRAYRRDNGDTVNLFIVYSPNNRQTSVPPEICLLGQGATITEKGTTPPTRAAAANYIIVETARGRELSVYWFRAGNINTTNYFKQQISVVMDMIRRRPTSVGYVHVTTEIKETTPAEAFNRLKSFCIAIDPLIATYAP